MPTLDVLLSEIEYERLLLINQKLRELYEAASWKQSRIGSPTVDYAVWIQEWLPKYIESLSSKIELQDVNGSVYLKKVEDE